MAIYVGTVGADSIEGTAADDSIQGNAGADFLKGGGGNDTLNGGADGDTIYVDSASDIVIEAAADTGTDTVLASVSYSLGADAAVEVLGYRATPAAGVFTAGSDLAATAAVNLTGNGFNQTVNGTAGANVLDGGRNTNPALSDTLVGGSGDDTYIVRNVADVITEAAGAGTGTDTVFVSAADLSAQGQAVATYTLNALANIEVLSAQSQRGTENLVLTGSSADAQQVVGNFGNNTLSGGGGGVDTLIGLDGNDTYSVVLGTEVIQETTGTDSIVFNSGGGVTAYTLAADVSIESITLGSSVVSVTGNNVAQTITGTAAVETLNGGGGVDTLVGGDGSDTYVVDVDGETITEIAGKGTADAVLIANAVGGGVNLADGVSIEVMATAETAAGNARLGSAGDINGVATAGTPGVYLVGNELSQTIYGAGGNDILDGDRGAGTNADVLLGGDGNDTYRVYNQTDVVAELLFSTAGVITPGTATGGTDTIFTSATYSLAANAAQVIAAGTNTLTAIERLSTASQAGTEAIDLTGFTNSETLIGNNGVNKLSGGLGGTAAANGAKIGDTLIGLGGNDAYTIFSANDVVQEAAGGGTDTLVFDATFSGTTADAGKYVLAAGAEVETITLISAVNDFTGSTFAQTVTGTTGVETIQGGGGADTLNGLAGNDVYYVIDANSAGTVINDTAGDETYNIGESSVTINDIAGVNTVVYVGTSGGFNVGPTLTTNSISATAAGTGDIYLVGNSGVQTITGNAGNNILNGAGGLGAGGVGDTLVGLGGNDTYRVYNSNYTGTFTVAASGDVVTEAGAGGTDTVYTSASFVLGANVENLIAADQVNVTTLTLVGNGLDNSISGSNGNNVLAGGDGHDYLTGLGGSDTFHFAGTIALANSDTIADFSSAQGDKISLDATSFAATGGAAAFGPTVDGAEFQNGLIATGAQATILYDQATGRVFFDSDGAGGGAAVLFAQLNPGTALSGTDFLITPAGTLPTPA